MTDRQKRFIDEYCVDQNGTQAAIRAGYSPRSARQTASEIMSYPDVRARIDERLAEIERETRSRAIATQTEIREFFTSLMRGEITEQQLDRNGIPVEVPAPARDRARGAELLGKTLGMFRDYVSAELELPQIVDDVTPEAK